MKSTRNPLKKIQKGTQGHSRWALQKIKKTLHRCKVLIIKVENIGIPSPRDDLLTTLIKNN